jgi:uncharacterized repeat protein (TIGR02543 family)
VAPIAFASVGTGCGTRIDAVATFAVRVEPAGGGVVTFNGRACDTDCLVDFTWSYDEDFVGDETRSRFRVDYSAVPASGFEFDGWTGGCSTSSCSVSLASGSTVTVTARFTPPSPPTIGSEPADATVAEGGAAEFAVTATGSGLGYQWQRSNGAGSEFGAIAGATAATYLVTNAPVSADGALFRAVVTNSGGSVTSRAARLTVLAGACPVPPRVPVDQTAPNPPSSLPGATLGTNLLIDGGFAQSVRVGTLPTGFGYWRADESATVAGQQGIAPRSAPTMLHFLGGGTVGVGSGVASEQVQLVDVSALAGQVDGDQLDATATLWVNRITGCALTDDAFGIQVVAYDGLPTTFPARQSSGVNQATTQGKTRDEATVVNAWLRYRSGSIRHRTPGTWVPVSVTMAIPPGTRFLAVIIHASENVAQDPVFPEFHGHYGDDASLVLTTRP